MRYHPALMITRRLLYLAIIVIFPGPSVLIFPVVQVDYNEPASLTCINPCSDVVRWRKAANNEVVAWCDQSSCTTERGYELPHEQVLSGNLSLVVTSADFSRRGWYTCSCGAKEICLVSLRITMRSLQTPIKASASLSLDLPIRERVEVIYKGTGGTDRADKQICTVDGRSLRCSDEYKDRAALVCKVELRDVKASAGDSFIIKDTENDEIIENHMLTVEEEPPPPVQAVPKPKESGYPSLEKILAVLLLIAVMIIVFLCTVKKD